MKVALSTLMEAFRGQRTRALAIISSPIWQMAPPHPMPLPSVRSQQRFRQVVLLVVS
jgi:hypothetical protein